MSKTTRPAVTDLHLDRLLVRSLVDFGIFVLSPKGVVVRWHPGARAIFGYDESEVFGRYFSFIFTSEDVASGAPEAELGLGRDGGAAPASRWLVRKDGTRFWGLNTLQPLRDGAGILLGYSKIVRDLSEQHAAAESLRSSEEQLRLLVATVREASLHDAVTGLANRQLFTESLNHKASDPRRRERNETFAVLFLDLDRFKSVNDTYGHLFADQLLVQVARRLEECIRDGDVLARFGGDEFAILIGAVSQSGDAVNVARRIGDALEAPFTIEGIEVVTTASIGIAVATLDSDFESPADILENADIAMYEAKSRGRARQVVFDERARASARATLQLDADLRLAVYRNEFRAYYQPIVDLRTRSIVGFEALVRWQHPRLGLLLPALFLQKAEESDVIFGLDQWIFAEAVGQLEAWQREFLDIEPLVMNVNFSARGFERASTVGDMKAVLARRSVRPGSVAVEVTESVSIAASDQARAALLELKSLGVEIVIDDFGTGYSGLSHLSRMPIDALKIDRSFVNGVASNTKNAEIIRAIVALARGLNLACIAEGVETVLELEKICELNCTTAQGFLFSTAVTAEVALEMLRSERRAGAGRGSQVAAVNAAC
jgi:diguanylate cyclase (GGDEF)-like protein/PAS domain S-box-containing protein